MNKHITNYLNALGFLSRIGPARILTPEDNAAALQQFPLAGLTIGAVASHPFFFGFGNGHPWVQAWIWVGLSIWFTRALHWDGWSDLADAWGSYATGDRFWEIMKDSRIGAFGGVSLAFGIAGQLIFAHDIFIAGNILALIWVPMFGRAANVALCPLGTPSPASTQGRLIMDSATPPVLVWTLGLTLIVGLWFTSLTTLLISCGLLALGLFTLVRLSKRQNGMNGDFMGAIVIWGELSAMQGIILG